MGYSVLKVEKWHHFIIIANFFSLEKQGLDFFGIELQDILLLIFIFSRFCYFVKLYFFKKCFRELCAVVLKTYRSLYSRNDKVTSVIHPSICRRNKTEIGWRRCHRHVLWLLFLLNRKKISQNILRKRKSKWRC